MPLPPTGRAPATAGLNGTERSPARVTPRRTVAGCSAGGDHEVSTSRVRLVGQFARVNALGSFRCGRFTIGRLFLRGDDGATADTPRYCTILPILAERAPRGASAVQGLTKRDGPSQKSSRLPLCPAGRGPVVEKTRGLPPSNHASPGLLFAVSKSGNKALARSSPIAFWALGK